MICLPKCCNRESKYIKKKSIYSKQQTNVKEKVEKWTRNGETQKKRSGNRNNSGRKAKKNKSGYHKETDQKKGECRKEKVELNL